MKRIGLIALYTLVLLPFSLAIEVSNALKISLGIWRDAVRDAIERRESQ